MDNRRADIALPAYSVLMSVYAGEDPDFFRQSIDSMLTQTYQTNDFVIVCDGPLTPELDGVIADFQAEYGFFNILRLGKKAGTGRCANAGLAICKNEYIVKMDSDDIALPTRCEDSLRLMARRPSIDVVGAYIQEFDSETLEDIAVKKTPTGSKAIMEYARRRNPFNNQTLVYKKSAALKAGGYSDIPRCEDYEFVVKLLSSGAIGRNIPKVLVRYRVTKGNYARRRNWVNTKSFIKVRWHIHKMGFSSLWDFLLPAAAQLALFAMPRGMTAFLYKKLLRK